MSGKLITFEGIDGCGKSTAIQAVKTYLEERGIPIFFSRQPGGTKYGEQIRQVLLHREDNHGEQMAHMTELLLFCASFAQSLHISLIPKMEEGIWILSDRYTDSTRAYQGAGRSLGIDAIDKILKASVEIHPLSIPAKTFLFDLPVEEADRRLNNANRPGGPDAIEQEGMTFQQKVRDCYLSLAKKSPQRFHIIDSGNLNQKETAQETINEIQKIIDT